MFFFLCFRTLSTQQGGYMCALQICVIIIIIIIIILKTVLFGSTPGFQEVLVVEVEVISQCV